MEAKLDSHVMNPRLLTSAAVKAMVAGIYGMNFDFMPELRWKFGYPLVVGSLVVLTAILYRKFKKSEWL